MKPAVGGLSHKELHGSGSALNVGGPGERTHSMHTPPAGIGNDKQMATEEKQESDRAAHDFSSASAPGNAGAGDRDVLSAGKGYFSPHGTGTELNKSGYDVQQYAADHAVPTANMAPGENPVKR